METENVIKEEKPIVIIVSPSHVVIKITGEIPGWETDIDPPIDLKFANWEIALIRCKITDPEKKLEESIKIITTIDDATTIEDTMIIRKKSRMDEVVSCVRNDPCVKATLFPIIVENPIRKFKIRIEKFIEDIKKKKITKVSDLKQFEFKPKRKRKEEPQLPNLTVECTYQIKTSELLEIEKIDKEIFQLQQRKRLIQKVVLENFNKCPKCKQQFKEIKICSRCNRELKETK